MKNNEFQEIIDAAVEMVKSNHEGSPASYIPELANVDPEKTGAALSICNSQTISAGDCDDYTFTLQSTAKLVLFIALLEEFGQEQVFSWIGVEPTGHSFAAIDYADRFSHLPSNPFINAGAIALSSRIPGKDRQAKMSWLDKWMKKLFGAELKINNKIYTSELDNADHNRSLAYLMRSQNVIEGDIEQILKVYTALCSYEVNILQAAQLPRILANRGNNCAGGQVLNEETVKAAISLMATCGLYNETGMYLLRTGMPAKSGVSGLILAVGIGYGGLAVYSPRITSKGGSVRGQLMLEYIAKKLGWHFAIPPL